MSTKRKQHGYKWHSEGMKKRRSVLDSGMKGFVCTCNGNESQSVKESYKLFNEYADKLYGPEETIDLSSTDLTDDLNAEVAALRKESEKPVEQRRFQVIESGVKNRLFIKTTLPDPVELVHRIFESEKDADVPKTRYLMRIFPVEATCKAYYKDIEAAAGKLFDKHFAHEEKTFSIVFNRHNNDVVERSEVISNLADMIKFRNPNHKVDLRHPQLTVIVDILRSVCCLSVVPNYMGLQKYNITELYEQRKRDKAPASEKLPPHETQNGTVDTSGKDDSKPSCDVKSETVDTSSKDGSKPSCDVKSEIVNTSGKDGSKPSCDVKSENVDTSGKDGGKRSYDVKSETVDTSVKDGSKPSFDVKSETVDTSSKDGSKPSFDVKSETVDTSGKDDGKRSSDVKSETVDTSGKDGSKPSFDVKSETDLQ